MNTELFQFFDERNRWLQMDDHELFALCRHENYVATGRGGQKRNKTASAVRLTHLSTGIVVTDCSGRSQHDNRVQALKKLRCEIAMRIRCAEIPLVRIDTSVRNTEYPVWIAMIVDRIVEAGYDMKAAAEALKVSRTGLLKQLRRDTVLWQFINHCREKNALPPLQPV